MSRYLRLSLAFSIVIFMFAACSPYKLVINEADTGRQISPPLQIETGDRVMYRTNIEIFRNNLSGLLVIVNADSLYKTGFVSEIGIKYFDMIIKDDGYEVVYCMEALDRKPVMNRIARSLKYILDDPAGFDGDFYTGDNNDLIYRAEDNEGWERIYHIENNKVESIEGRRFLRKRILVNGLYNDEKQPENIIFLHKGFRMKIEMRKL